MKKQTKLYAVNRNLPSAWSLTLNTVYRNLGVNVDVQEPQTIDTEKLIRTTLDNLIDNTTDQNTILNNIFHYAVLKISAVMISDAKKLNWLSDFYDSKVVGSKRYPSILNEIIKFRNEESLGQYLDEQINFARRNAYKSATRQDKKISLYHYLDAPEDTKENDTGFISVALKKRSELNDLTFTDIIENFSEKCVRDNYEPIDILAALVRIAELPPRHFIAASKKFSPQVAVKLLFESHIPYFKSLLVRLRQFTLALENFIASEGEMAASNLSKRASRFLNRVAKKHVELREELCSCISDEDDYLNTLNTFNK